jgi:uncharacterized membrane protein
VEVPRQGHETKEIAEFSIPRRPRPVEETKKASEDRIVMLSDGIFAIAVTLLVLSIQIPHVATEEEFQTALKGDFSQNTLFYIITFAVLAAYWTNHRRLMSVVTRVDRPFLWLNLVFLAFVAYFPVASSLLSSSPYPEAVIIYTIVLVGCGYSVVLLWVYALAKHRLIPANSAIGYSKSRILGAATTPTFFLASLLLLYIPQISSAPGHLFYSWLLLPLINIVYIQIVRFSKRGKSDV